VLIKKSTERAPDVAKKGQKSNKPGEFTLKEKVKNGEETKFLLMANNHLWIKNIIPEDKELGVLYTCCCACYKECCSKSIFVKNLEITKTLGDHTCVGEMITNIQNFIYV
jgi:hypothetical protein